MDNVKNRAIVVAAASMIVVGAGSSFLFFKYKAMRHADVEYVEKNIQSPVAATLDGMPQDGTIKVIEKVVSSAQLWRPIQERVKDTVVQIFSHVAVVDLLRPYRSPTEGSAYGSGFFISDQGDIITNAHVVDQARSVWIQIPSLGKRIIDVDVVGISPDRDVALLRVRPESLAIIKKELGAVPFLPLGDSDLVLRSDEVLALGYPLGQQSLKSTNGIISGREHSMIQMSAPINPGSSGGPLLNTKGQVVGINSAGIVEAQNVGYAISINDLKIVLPDLYKVRIVRKPFLGVLFNNASDSLTEFLGNPFPGGCYVVEVVKGSPLEKAGVKQGDMIYSINGYRIDIFGDMTVPWSEDKISLIEYVSRLSIGEQITLVVYRSGNRKEFAVTFGYAELPTIHKIYPGYDAIDYEIFAGMVIMPLTLNHIQLIGPQAPGLAYYAEMRRCVEPVLVVTHIFRNSQLFRARIINPGCTLKEVNGIEVRTLDDLRKAFAKGMNSKFLTVRASDNVSRTTDSIFLALPLASLLKEEPQLAKDYHYPITEHTKELLSIADAQAALTPKEHKV
ncbi:MAG: trypsin-like peptidase domain-containing protein [Candidatus Dependentiae bacterium]|nr:trypsin-like peptidase domain-containing protein [Candidatus Dependentiae bacterium]